MRAERFPGFYESGKFLLIVAYALTLLIHPSRVKLNSTSSNHRLHVPPETYPYRGDPNEDSQPKPFSPSSHRLSPHLFSPSH
jgi:hypothetical protein